MATKDPHIAYIDTREQLERIQFAIRQVTDAVKAKIQAGGKLTELEKHDLEIFRARAIESTRRIQDAYAKEIESHGKLTD